MQWLQVMALLGQSQSGEMDRYSYTAIISACEAASAWRQAWHVFKLQDNMSIATIEAFNSAMTCVQWQAAMDVLGRVTRRRLVPSLVSCDATSSTCARALVWAQGLHIMAAMRSWLLHDTVLASTATATACFRSQNCLAAVQFLTQTGWFALNKCLREGLGAKKLLMIRGLVELERDFMGFSAMSSRQPWNMILSLQVFRQV
eukprot:Skav224345  [mRNA]  locus=scaffold2411:194371:194976:- [translate_table: standard]